MTERWQVLGPGAIGSLFAAYLQRGGSHVVLLDHRNGEDTRRGVAIDGLEPTGHFEFPVSPVGAQQPITHLLVTTKAYTVLPAMQSVAHRLIEDSQVVVMVNGMGLDEAIRKAFPDLALAMGTTTEGAYRREDSTLCHAGSGSTRVGRTDTPGVEPDWFDAFSRSVPDCRWEPDMGECLWRKLAINAAINPLTAVLGCNNGVLAGEPAARVRSLCSEITAVAEAAGMAHAVNDLEATVFEVIHSTASNRSSMLQDVEAGRPTEIDFITGWLVRQANHYGVATPQNAELLERVRKHGS